MADTLKIWVLTDGRAGNEAQALGLAEAVARARPAVIEIKRIKLKPWAALIPARWSYRLGTMLKGWPFSSIAEGRDELDGPLPQLVIGAGRRSAPLVAALKAVHGFCAIQILHSGLLPSVFDAVVVPSHDSLAGENVITTLGAVNRITDQRISAAMEPWAERFGALARPRVAVLVGGPSGSCHFEEKDQRRLLSALATLETDHRLIVTTSRRTPVAFANAISGALSDESLVCTPDGLNPFPGMLGAAQAALVTEDSVNMASECATAGLPVHVFPISSVSPKIARFHEALKARGASRQFDGEVRQWSYTALREADRVVQDLTRRGIV